MTVYVDEAVFQWRGTRWCHMFADTSKELHAFALKLGLKLSWFQNDPRLPHYDVSERRRRIAVRLGAVEVDRRVTFEHIKRNREKIRRKPKR